MRITGGTGCGLKLTGPKKQHSKLIRPTSDRVRESLFSILGSRIINSSVLDLFAGTGALGIESLSRGASKAIFADHYTPSLELIRKNLHHSFKEKDTVILKLRADKQTAIKKISTSAANHLPFDIIFLDPPYEQNLAKHSLIMLENTNLLAQTGCIVVEERAHVKLPDKEGRLVLTEQRKYGETGIWIYTCL